MAVRPRVGPQSNAWEIDTVAVGYRQRSALLTAAGAELRSGKQDVHSLQPAQQLSRDPLFPVGPDYPPHKLAQLHRNQLCPSAGDTSSLGSTTPQAPTTDQGMGSSAAGLLTGVSKTLKVSRGFLIQIICLLLPACILQSNSTRG